MYIIPIYPRHYAPATWRKIQLTRCSGVIASQRPMPMVLTRNFIVCLYTVRPSELAIVYTGNDIELPFLPRDAMRKNGTSCRPVSVRRSVCPSICHTCVLYPNG